MRSRGLKDDPGNGDTRGEDRHARPSALVSTPFENVTDKTAGLHPKPALPPEPAGARPRVSAAEGQYRSLVERIPVVTYTAEFGANCHWHFVSPQIETMLGYTPAEWCADPDLWYERIHPEDRPRVLEADEASRRTGSPFSSDYRMIARDGREVWVRDEAVVTEHDGAPMMEGILLDITEQKRAEQARAQAEERFRLAFANAPIGMCIVAPDGTFMQGNRALFDMLGYPADELIGKTFQEITHPDDLEADIGLLNQVLDGAIRTYQMEKRYFHSTGRIVWANLSVSLVRDADGKPLHFISQVEDITDRKRAHERLEYLADHDPLTGLPNRRRFEEELSRQVAYAERYGTSGALLLLDLDNFKTVNDTLGHRSGDDLLKTLSGLLRSRLRRTDFLGRLGGDELAVLLPEVDTEQAMVVAGELVEAIRHEQFLLAGKAVHTTASLGVAIFTGSRPRTPDELLMDADLAMYEAKGAGRDRYAVRAIAAVPSFD
jgi:diguanylate cyclase (GGDEF)-like protein/PAS domain S-box-containing protein